MQDLNTIVSKFVLFEKESKLIGIFKNIIDVLESNRRDHEQVKLKLLKLLSEKINSLDLDIDLSDTDLDFFTDKKLGFDHDDYNLESLYKTILTALNLHKNYCDSIKMKLLYIIVEKVNSLKIVLDGSDPDIDLSYLSEEFCF